MQAEAGGTSGGPSLIWAQPPYQHGVVPTALATAPGNRNPGLVWSEPDIAADADIFTGVAIGLLTFSQDKPPNLTFPHGGGTSIAAPLDHARAVDIRIGRGDRGGLPDLSARAVARGAIDVSGTPTPVTGNATWFSGLGWPYSGCGPAAGQPGQPELRALNVQNSPGDYSKPACMPPRPPCPSLRPGNPCSLWAISPAESPDAGGPAPPILPSSLPQLLHPTSQGENS